jgi:L-alanine-DL-glutamate epimerase-like enolase superfamily enzyme
VGECEEPFFTAGLDMLKSVYIGADPCDVQELFNTRYRPRMARTKELSALEMACWNIMGKKAGLPVYKLMGGAAREKVAIALFEGVKPIEETVADVVAAVEQGIRTIKVKAGLNIKRDIDVLREIRDAVGDELELRVDANDAWTVPTAISVINQMEKFRVQYVEGPIRGYDWDGYKRIRDRVGVPLCICTALNGDGAMSSEAMLGRLTDLVGKEAVDVVSTDPMRTGGMFGFQKACAICEGAGVQVVTHWPRQRVSQAAWLHLCISNYATTLAQVIIPPGLGVGPVEDIITEPFRHEDGYMKPNERPGLGVDLDHDQLARYAVDIDQRW